MASNEKLGELCHNCRHRSHEEPVRCSRDKCNHKFCRPCLLNRHGEDIDSERAANVRWVCPRCRGGCGAGCVKSCCHCSTCRRSRKLEATGEVIKTARLAGFNNVHDYLVHKETGESPTAIADRKKGRGWTSIDAISEPLLPQNTHEFIRPMLDYDEFFDDLQRNFY